MVMQRAGRRRLETYRRMGKYEMIEGCNAWPPLGRSKLE